MEKVRDLSSTLDVRSLSIDEICSKLNISKPAFFKILSQQKRFDRANPAI